MSICVDNYMFLQIALIWTFKQYNYYLKRLFLHIFVFKKMMGNVINTLLQVCLQDLNWVQYLVSYCLCYVLSDKTSENSAKKGTYQNAYFWHFWTLAPLLEWARIPKNGVRRYVFSIRPRYDEFIAAGENHTLFWRIIFKWTDFDEIEIFIL